MIDVKSAKGICIGRGNHLRPQDVPRPFQNQRWMGIPLPFPLDCNEYIVDGVIGAGVV